MLIVTLLVQEVSCQWQNMPSEEELLKEIDGDIEAIKFAEVRIAMEHEFDQLDAIDASGYPWKEVKDLREVHENKIEALEMY